MTLLNNLYIYIQKNSDCSSVPHTVVYNDVYDYHACRLILRLTLFLLLFFFLV